MERSLRLLVPTAMVLLFVVIFAAPLRETWSGAYRAVRGISILIFVYCGGVSLVLAVRHLRRRDFRGAAGVFSTILVFGVLLFLLFSYLTLL